MVIKQPFGNLGSKVGISADFTKIMSAFFQKKAHFYQLLSKSGEFIPYTRLISGRKIVGSRAIATLKIGLNMSDF